MKTLVEKMREQRMFWVEFDATHKVRVLPPTDLQIMESLEKGLPVIDPKNISALVHDWVGFTEEDFLGKGIGSTDPLALDRPALDEWLSMSIESVNQLVSALHDRLVEKANARKDAEKN